MQSKLLVRFYAEHCSRTVAKISSCEKALTALEAQLFEMNEHSNYMQSELDLLWEKFFGKAIRQSDIYTLKRQEALIISRYDELQLQVEETTSSIDKMIKRRDEFIKARMHYEKKKNKWEWMSDRAKKMRIRKDIHKDEQVAEECITWIAQ